MLLKLFKDCDSFTLWLPKLISTVNVFFHLLYIHQIFSASQLQNMSNKNKNNNCFHLPRINNTHSNNTSNLTSQQKLEFTTQENQSIIVTALDDWNADNKITCKSSKTLAALKRASNLHNHLMHMPNIQTSEVIEANSYLLRYEQQLKKLEEVDYQSIFKNVEYCSGVYSSIYNPILKTLLKNHSAVWRIYNQIANSLEQQRAKHIQNMQGASANDDYKQKIPLIRQIIEQKQNQLESLTNIIQNLQHAKIKVLKHSLNLGYDVREEGIIWILRELHDLPKIQEFPSFLNERQIKFITDRFERQKLAKENQGQSLRYNLSSLCKKSVNDISDDLSRHKKRQLSMIKEGQIMQQLQKTYLHSFLHAKHKYLDADILKLAQKENRKPKATKYQIIYKQTLKKLNRFCVNEIYNRNNYHTNNKHTNNKRRESINTIKMLSLVQSQLATYIQQIHTDQTSLNQQDKELDQIIRSLRYESYQQASKSERRPRNIVSIVCCLVGCKRARKIIEQEMNYLI